jgi:hypothetical protein
VVEKREEVGGKKKRKWEEEEEGWRRIVVDRRDLLIPRDWVGGDGLEVRAGRSDSILS